MKKTAEFAITWIAVLIGALVVVLVPPIVETKIDEYRRAREDREHYQRTKDECQRHLRALAEACAAYRADHGTLPTTLQALYRGGYADGRTLMCPGAWDATASRGRIDDQADYVYSSRPGQGDGNVSSGEPYPLLYDRTLADHRGGGINILMSDGSVKWDEKARWVQQYASARPQEQIRLPHEKRPETVAPQEPAWLIRNQEADGSWAVRRWGGTGDESNRVGVTGLAVLAFLSNGNTEKAGEMKDHVQRAVAFLVGCQQSDGRLGLADQADGLAMFNHATSGLALSEAFAMSRFDETGLAARRALAWTLRNQHPSGGWPRSVGGAPDFDTSVLCMIQLRSGACSGLQVGKRAMRRARDWILKAAESPDDRGHHAAGAIAALHMTGGEIRDCEPWADILLAEAAADHRLHALRQLGCWWEAFPEFPLARGMAEACGASDREVIRELRVVRLDGSPLHLSWDPVEDGGAFGRAYSTAAAELSLTWYYRYLPIQK